MKKTLTVFTPTYNRAYTLHLGYEALKRQTLMDFKWLIIDDGSTDNTKDLVDQWKKEGFVEIEYIYKENGGMHTAHNIAYENIKTELNVCIDSDDYMPDDAVEKIVEYWSNNRNDNYAGMLALDAFADGSIIGTVFKEKMLTTTLSGYYKNGGKGDKKLIYRTDVVKSYPAYPTFEEEKYYGLNYKYLLIDQDYRLLTLNHVVCIVEYQESGSSKNMLKQYWRNPRGFAHLRLFYMKYDKSLKSILRNTIHYISSKLTSADDQIIKKTPYPFISIILYPFGYLLYLYIREHNISKQ